MRVFVQGLMTILKGLGFYFLGLIWFIVAVIVCVILGPIQVACAFAHTETRPLDAFLDFMDKVIKDN